MSSDNFADFLTELKAKNDITDVIGSYIKLERRGYNYWACCPFHHEKTPSFSVNASEKYYHCFGCGASGDVIGFVKNYENVDFNQAVQLLAARANMEVPVYDNRSQDEIRQKKQEKDRLLSLMKDTARFYLNNLYSGKADAHLEYLSKRKLTPTIMKKFGLGASLDFESLPKYLLDKGYTAEEAEKSGACAMTERGKLIDAQGGRLIIPIINNLDEVIGFGGRLIQKSDRAKYKNTKDTPLFDKRKNLYNINLVKKLHRAGGIPYLIMVEGYMDVISLYQAGFENVVASMGTSLTKEQARLCKRYSENVYISYDGDFAGQKANLRGLEIMKQEGVKVKVVPLPDGQDPDDVIKTSGAAGYQKCLDAAMPLIDFRIHALKLKYDLRATDQRRDYVKEALMIVRESESATEREELLKRLAAESGYSLTALSRDLEQAPAPSEKSEPAPPRPREEGNGDKKAERYVLAACLFNKPYAEKCDLNLLHFTDETQVKIADYILDERLENGRVRPSGLFDLSLDENELSNILDLETGYELDGEHAERYFSDCVLALQRRALTEQIESCKHAYDEAQTAEEKREILELLGELMKKQKNLK